MIATKFDGNEATIINPDHPHFESNVICLGADHTIVGYAMKFKRIDTDEEFYVFHGRQIKWKK